MKLVFIPLALVNSTNDTTDVEYVVLFEAGSGLKQYTELRALVEGFGYN